MHKVRKILHTLRNHAVLYLCICLNTIGFLIGGWLYYKETFFKHRTSASSPLKKMDALRGEIG